MSAANAPLHSSALENERRAHEPSMEEILASIRKIIADDDALPLTRPTAETRSSFTTPKPFETPAREARQAETNVTALTPRPTPAVRDFDPPVLAEFVAPAPAAPAAEPPAAAEPVEAPASKLAEPPRLDEADLASFAEIANELSSHDLRPAIEDEPVDDVIADIRAAVAATPEPDEAPEAEEAEPPVRIEPRARAEAAPVMLSPEADASVSSAFRALSASVQLTNSETIDRHVRDLLRPMLKQWLDDNLPVMVERLVRTEIERVARGGR